MKTLFRATFTLRRNVVITVENGAVQTLIEMFPLLADMEFVSFNVSVFMKKFSKGGKLLEHLKRAACSNCNFIPTIIIVNFP